MLDHAREHWSAAQALRGRPPPERLQAASCSSTPQRFQLAQGDEETCAKCGILKSPSSLEGPEIANFIHFCVYGTHQAARQYVPTMHSISVNPYMLCLSKQHIWLWRRDNQTTHAVHDVHSV